VNKSELADQCIWKK